MNNHFKLLFFTALLTLTSCANNVNTSSSSIFSTDSSISTSSEANDSSSSSSIIEEKIHFNDEDNSAIESDIIDIINKSSYDNKLYRISGTMQYVQNETYGNFELTDETGSILIYGLSKSSSSIKYENGTYKFNNRRDFAQLDLHGGDIVTIEGIFDYFSYDSGYKVLEFMGYPTDAIKTFRYDVIPLSYEDEDPYLGNYYDSIKSSSGKDLAKELHNLMMSTHDNYISYSSLKGHFYNTDTKGHSTPYCFYSNNPISNLNREHVWPKSLSNDVFYESYGGADLHHLRATEANVNSLRSNTRFAPMFDKDNLNIIPYSGGGYNYYGAKSSFGCFEPADDIKGDIARIIAYVYIHYTSTFGGTLKDGITGELYLNDVLGVGEYEVNDLLCNWNAIDPVDEYEIQRNEYAFKIQGNRNPFIDKPSYIDYVFGNL